MKVDNFHDKNRTNFSEKIRVGEFEKFFIGFFLFMYFETNWQIFRG